MALMPVKLKGLLNINLLDFHKVGSQLWDFNVQDAVLKLGTNALDINLSRRRPGSKANLAVKSADLALVKSQGLQKSLITRAVDDTGDAELALLGVPADANVLFVRSRERDVDDECRLCVKDVGLGLPVVTGLGGSVGLATKHFVEEPKASAWITTHHVVKREAAVGMSPAAMTAVPSTAPSTLTAAAAAAASTTTTAWVVISGWVAWGIFWGVWHRIVGHVPVPVGLFVVSGLFAFSLRLLLAVAAATMSETAMMVWTAVVMMRARAKWAKVSSRAMRSMVSLW